MAGELAPPSTSLSKSFFDKLKALFRDFGNRADLRENQFQGSSVSPRTSTAFLAMRAMGSSEWESE